MRLEKLPAPLTVENTEQLAAFQLIHSTHFELECVSSIQECYLIIK